MCVGQRRALCSALTGLWSQVGQGPVQAPLLLVMAGAAHQQGRVSVAAAPGHGRGGCASPAPGLPWRHVSQECPGHSPRLTLPSRNQSLEGADATTGSVATASPQQRPSHCPGPNQRNIKKCQGMGGCAAPPLTSGRHGQEVPRPVCPSAPGSRPCSGSPSTWKQGLAAIRPSSLRLQPLHLLLVLLDGVPDPGVHHGLGEDSVLRGIRHGLAGRERAEAGRPEGLAAGKESPGLRFLEATRGHQPGD